MGIKYLRLDKHMPIHETRDIKCPESSCSTSEKLYNEVSLKYYINYNGINEGFDVPTGDDDGGQR